MISLLVFFHAYWKPLGGAMLVLLLGSAIYQGAQLYQRHRLAKKVEAAVSHHAARQLRDTHSGQSADSQRFELLGQRRELNRSLHFFQHDDDSLTAKFPAMPVLPAAPPLGE